MKNFLILFICLLLNAGISFGQTSGPAVTHKNQYDLQNEFYVAYGFGSVYYYINQNTNSEWSYTTPGSFIAGYTRSLNRVIGVGFQVCYTPMKGTYNLSSTGVQTKNYNYIQGLARVKFQYLNKPMFGMYSGIAIGVTMDYHSETSSNGKTTNHQYLYPAGQLTLLGFRVGRTAAFMGEFGIGTLSILNLGFSCKFGN